MITAAMAKGMYLNHLKEELAAVKRLPTGLCHYVYLVENNDGNKHIVRASMPENRKHLKGSVYWLKALEVCDIAIPRILFDGTDYEIPYLIMSYIEGIDLGEVYHELEDGQKESLAESMIDIQRNLQSVLTSKDGQFGYLSVPDDPEGKSTWLEVVEAHIQRSRDRIAENGVFDLNYVSRVEAMLPKFKGYLLTVEPKAFLDDATTKNVLMHEGRLSGIVDLDAVCFGDRLYQVALTRMALLSIDCDTHYIDYWIHKLNLNDEEYLAFDFYTLAFCIDFMSEIGMRFNKDEIIEADESVIQRLKALYEQLYVECAEAVQ